MTIKELKQAIKDVPDEYEVWVDDGRWKEWDLVAEVDQEKKEFIIKFEG